MSRASVPRRIGQRTAGIIAALVLSLFTFSAQAAAWSTPTLTGACAPDASHYGWTIDLPHEADYKIDLAFNNAFTGATMTDFATPGAHSFTTARDGSKLYVRWSTDHHVSTSATANATLCGTGSTGGTVAGSQQNNIKNKDKAGTEKCQASTNETGDHNGDHQHQDTNSSTSCGTTAGSQRSGGTQQCTGAAVMKSHGDIEGASQGGTATVSFTMSNGCTGKELSLVSYTAPSAAFSRENADQQRIFQAKTGTFANGVFVLSVQIPSCFFQVDFVMGKPIAQFGPAGSENFYSDQGRLIAGVNGGSMGCNTTTSGSPTTPTATMNSGNGSAGNTQTVTQESAFVGSSPESQQPGETATVPSGNAVAGFQTPPSNAVGAVTPIVELPGGSNQQSPSAAINGAQTGPVAGVQTLPSTSTDGTPTIPLAALGVAIMALGGVLLRRRETHL